jgi:hypothetical protein
MSRLSEATHPPTPSFRAADLRPGPRWRRRIVPLAAAGALALAGAAVHAASATPSADAVISEVYGGGGNSGALYTSDFIELANAGGSPLGLGGYSVQYLRGTPAGTSTWRATPLAGTLAAGGRYLVGEWSNTGGSLPLPAPDATGTINMSATDGTVALVSGTAPLTCLTAAACTADPRVRDLVGYGAAVVHEGAGPAAGAGNAVSVARTPSLYDTDDNAADFVPGAPTPQDTADGGDSTGGMDGGGDSTGGANSGATVGTTSGGDDEGATVGVTGGSDDGGTVGVTSGGDTTSGTDSGATVGTTSGDDEGATNGADNGGTVGVTGGSDDGGTVGVISGGDSTGGADSGATAGADEGSTVGVTGGSDDGSTPGPTG